MPQDPTGAEISPDGLWRWDGQVWVPNQALSRLPAPLAFGDVISIPARDPRWFGKCGIQGLIALIPIYGSFELLGWSLSYLDNLRAGRPWLPEAGFGYARRGFRTGLVALIYSLVGVILFYAAFGAVFFAMVSTAPQGTAAGSAAPSGAGSFPAFFFAGFFALQGALVLLYGLLHLVVVPVILRTERHGVAAGLNLIGAARLAMDDPRTAGLAAVLVFLVWFIASLGVYACLVGVVFSYGYAAAMLGATVRWYEERLPAAQE